MHAEAKRSEAAAGTHLPNPQLEGPALCSAPSANMFYLRTGHRAQSKWYSVRWMHILANQYAELPSKCGGVTTGTVAHVRTLDMNPSQAVHPAYGQPPLSFYLSAWNHTGDNTLHVVHKDLSSPVAKTLDVLRRSTNMPIKMHSHDRFKHDLLILLCAKNLIMSRSSLNFIVLMNPRLRRMYHYEKPSDGPHLLSNEPNN
jgi:hypothetical protein